MRNDTTIETINGNTLALTGEERTMGKLVMNGTEYVGEVGNPVGKDSPDQWIEWSLLKGLYAMPAEEYRETMNALYIEMT